MSKNLLFSCVITLVLSACGQKFENHDSMLSIQGHFDILVRTLEDTGVGSLRAAFTEAERRGGPQTIRLPKNMKDKVISLNNSIILKNATVTLEGTQTSPAILSKDFAFYINKNSSFIAKKVKFIYGDLPKSKQEVGAIFNSGEITLLGCAFEYKGEGQRGVGVYDVHNDILNGALINKNTDSNLYAKTIVQDEVISLPTSPFSPDLPLAIIE